jgi:hypothetical protein
MSKAIPSRIVPDFAMIALQTTDLTTAPPWLAGHPWNAYPLDELTRRTPSQVRFPRFSLIGDRRGRLAACMEFTVATNGWPQ